MSGSGVSGIGIGGGGGFGIGGTVGVLSISPELSPLGY